MMRQVVSVAAAVGASLLSLGASQKPAFRAGTHTVSIYATVVDRGGQLVSGLTRDDFEIFDNAVRQPIDVFASDRQPISIVIMLDRSGSMRSHYSLVRDATEEFVGHLWPEDRVRIGSFSNRVQIDPESFTTDRDELARILREELQDAGATPLWNATSAAMNALSRQDGRRVVLLFTDGEDAPEFGRENVGVSQIKARAEVDEAMIYAIGLAETCEPKAPKRNGSGSWGLFQRRPPQGPAGEGSRLSGFRRVSPCPDFRRRCRGFHCRQPRIPSSPRTDYREGCAGARPDPDLREVAAIGGGGYFELDSTSNLRRTFSRIADELHQQYLLAFTASTLDNTLHRLEVRAKDRDLTVRARRSYFAGSPQ